MSRRKLGLGTLGLAAIAATVTLGTTAASAHGLSTVTIRHQMRGCHTWSFDGGPYKASLRVTVDPGRFVRGDTTGRDYVLRLTVLVK